MSPLLFWFPAALAGPRWEAPRTPVIEAFPGTTGITAASCGQCHAEIATEWAASTHAHAWVDRQFQKELAKDPEVAWLCVNCHIPVANQQAELTRATGDVRNPERTPNSAFDASFQQEGITCLACHWREGGIAAPHEDAAAPHPTVFAPDLLEAELCTGCHQAVARLEDALVCTFNTGQERIDSGETRTCQSCHMPAIKRSVAPGGKVRTTGRHHWPGSGIPKDEQSPAEQQLFADWKPGLEATLTGPTTATPGESVQVVARYTNARTGHMLPTGDPERYLLIEVVATDSMGAEIARASQRIGQTWEWWPVARKLDDNRLARGESRELALRFEMPASAVQARLTVDHYRISPENAAYHELDGYPTHRRIVDQPLVVDTASAGR